MEIKVQQMDDRLRNVVFLEISLVGELICCSFAVCLDVFLEAPLIQLPSVTQLFPLHKRLPLVAGVQPSGAF